MKANALKIELVSIDLRVNNTIARNRMAVKAIQLALRRTDSTKRIPAGAM
jgi:hypothetical protein